MVSLPQLRLRATQGAELRAYYCDAEVCVLHRSVILALFRLLAAVLQGRKCAGVASFG